MQRLAAFIPARVGSKGVPYKNFRKFKDGTTLLSRTVQAAAAAKLDPILVSTDARHGDYPTSYQAEHRARRPEHATDAATVAAVLCDLVGELREREVDAVMVLYPTYALRETTDLDWVHEMWLEAPERGLVGIVPSKEPAHLLVEVGGGHVYPIVEHAWSRPNRQRHLTSYRLCLFACVVPVDQIKDLPGQPVAPGSRALEIPEHKALDVDTWEDWHRAEEILCGK